MMHRRVASVWRHCCICRSCVLSVSTGAQSQRSLALEALRWSDFKEGPGVLCGTGLATVPKQSKKKNGLMCSHCTVKPHSVTFPWVWNVGRSQVHLNNFYHGRHIGLCRPIFRCWECLMFSSGFNLEMYENNGWRLWNIQRSPKSEKQSQLRLLYS